VTDGGPLSDKPSPGTQIVVVDTRVAGPPPKGPAGAQPLLDKAADKSSSDNGAAGRRWEVAKTAVETVKGGLLVLLMVAGLFYGLPLIQAQHTKAQRDETIARAEIATREAAEKQILELDLSAQLLGAIEHERYVLVTLELKNTGNRELSIPAEHLAASITNVRDIEADGQIRYGERHPFLFGAYPDAKVSEMKISPGERRKLQSVQKLRSEGLHLVTAEVSLSQRPSGNEGFHANLFTDLY